MRIKHYLCAFSMLFSSANLLAVQEPDHFAQFLPNIYRNEAFSTIMEWQEAHKGTGITPRQKTIQTIKELDCSADEEQWLLSALDIPSWTLINELYIGSPEKQPLLFAKLEELAKKYDIAVPTILIPDLGMVNMMAPSYNSDTNVIVIPFGAFANKVWDTAAFEGFLAHECGHLKHNDSVALTRVNKAMRIMRAAAFMVPIVWHMATHFEKDCENKKIPSSIGKMLGKGVVGYLLTWPVDVCIRAVVRRRIENRADRLAGEHGYGQGLAQGLKRMGLQYKVPPAIEALQAFGRRFKRLYHVINPPEEETMRHVLSRRYGYLSDTARSNRVYKIAAQAVADKRH